MNARVFSHSERGVWCFGIASSDAFGKLDFLWFLTFLNPLRPDTQDIIATAGALRIQVKMIIDGHVAIAKETCRVIGRGIQILTTEVIPAIETDLLVGLESMWRVLTTLWVSILSTISKMFRCAGGLNGGARLGGSTESFTRGLDWRVRLGSLVWDLYVARTRLVYQGSDAALSFLPRLLQQWGLWCGGSGIHYPSATDLAGGRSPNVVDDHCSGVARKSSTQARRRAPHHTHTTSSALIWIVGEGVSECWCRAGV